MANPPSRLGLDASEILGKPLPNRELRLGPAAGTGAAFEFEFEEAVCYELSVSHGPNRARRERMKLLSYLSVMAAGAILAVGAAVAQTNPTTGTAAQTVRDGTVVTAAEVSNTDATPTSSLRPNRPERRKLPPEVLTRLQQFETDRKKYLAEQQALKKQLVGANDEERAALQERLKLLRDHWRELSLERRKEYKERQQELADKLPEYRELIDSLPSTPQQQARDAKDEIETRRGDP